jgi:hypothetical protein
VEPEETLFVVNV